MAATHVFVNGVPLARGKFDLWMEGGGPQLVVDVTRPLELPQRVEKKTVKRPLSAGPRRRPQSALARPQSARMRPATAKPPPPPKESQNETAQAIERLRKQLASKENKTVARLRKALAQEKELLKRERMLVTRERARVARLEKSAELAKRMSKKKGTTAKVVEDEDPYADDFVEPVVKKDDSLTKEEVIETCRNSLTAYKVPKVVKRQLSGFELQQTKEMQRHNTILELCIALD
mgnify:CR=1 FL=1